MSACRCGHDLDDQTIPHPCHGEAYTCRKPAKRRFYNAKAVALAGVQPKFQMDDTWACDECWAEFSKELDKQKPDPVVEALLKESFGG